MTTINIGVIMTLENHCILKSIKEDFICQITCNSVDDFTDWVTIKCNSRDTKAIQKRLKRLTYKREE